MKVIVYRGYEWTDFYEVTLKHFKVTNNYDFEMDKDWEDLTEALEEEYPFEIVECTELELDVFKKHLDTAYDAFGLDEVKADEIVVKLYQFDRNYIVPYEEAAKERFKEFENLLDKLNSIKEDLKLYNYIYEGRYGEHLVPWEDI